MGAKINGSRHFNFRFIPEMEKAAATATTTKKEKEEEERKIYQLNLQYMCDIMVKCYHFIVLHVFANNTEAAAWVTM